MLRFAVVLTVMIIAFGSVSTLAQDATPAAGDCQVEPRPIDQVTALAELASTPAAESVAVLVTLPDGGPVAEETIGTLLATLNEAEACSEVRDLLRFLALYSDDYIVRAVFGPEPAGVTAVEQPLQPSNAAGTPTPPPVTVIDDAVLLDDGSIAAHVFTTGTNDFGSIIWFLPEGDRWVIDDIQASANPPSGRNDVPAGAEGIVSQVIAEAASSLEVESEDVEVASIKAVDWPDAALGCPEEGGVYAAVVTPGYRIIVTDGSTTLTYHTDLQGAVVNCSE